jgi:integral membrane protein
MKHNRTYLLLLIWFGIIEGLSTLFLFFVAMPMKYIYSQPELVSKVGMLHGILFLCLIAMFVIGKSQMFITTRMMWGGIVGAILPFGPFVVDVKLYKLLQPKK